MLASLLLVSLAVAEEGGLSDAETNYTGAIILEGKIDASVASYGPGETYGDGWAGDIGQTEYAYWSGNTLYMGAEDGDGNVIDGIVEFFWFESSVDRGADFYVAVIKVRSTPNQSNSYYLLTGDDNPVQQVWAKGAVGDSQAFRWDWSLPFESYGLDSYGQATLRNSYGVGASAEGSAMYAETYEKDETTKVEGKVQAKGNVSSEYNVKTEFTTELWHWETKVLGRPGEMKWSTELTNDHQAEESAYYEYFLVMQAEEGTAFTIDSLEISGGFDEWTWGYWNEFSVSVNDIELSRPAYTPDEPVDTGDTDTGEVDTGDTDTGGFDTDTGGSDPSAGGPGGGPSNPFADPGEDSGGFFGCSSVAGGSFAGFGLLLAGLALVFRRRD